jgi:hypothetical protein
LVGEPGIAPACAIPVFRYALEYWQPSPYELIVYHQGPLDAQALGPLHRLERATQEANLTLRVVDLAGAADPVLRQTWQNHACHLPQPCLVVRFPETDDTKRPAWSAPLTEQTVSVLLDSLARRRCVEMLTEGASVVFVLLAGGDAQADEKTLALLKCELARLEKTVQLPPASNEGPQVRSPIPVKVSFPVLVVSRQTAAEKAFVQLLLHSDAELGQEKGPIVFPLLGRGRVVGSLCGQDLTAANLARAAHALCGPCACEIKTENPGLDMLVSANWEQLLRIDGLPPGSPRVSRSFQPPADVDQDLQPDPAALPLDPGSSGDWFTGPRRWRWAVLATACLLVLVTGLWVYWTRLRGSQRD